MAAGSKLDSPRALVRHFATAVTKPDPSNDNSSVVAVELDMKKPANFVIGVMDGHGGDGEIISEQVRDLLVKLIPAR